MVLKVVIQQSTFNITYTFACVQIRHNPLSGGYCGEVPPLPIPNREVKLTCADGTAMQCGRVGSRLLSISEASITKVVGAFLFVCSFAFLSQLYPTAPLPFYSFTFKSLLHTYLYSNSLHYHFLSKIPWFDQWGNDTPWASSCVADNANGRCRQSDSRSWTPVPVVSCTNIYPPY